MNVVRTYNFRRASSTQTFECRVFIDEPDYQLFTSKPNPVIIDFELGEPLSKVPCPSRIRVNAPSDIPSRFVIDEVTRFFETLKQMYQL